MGGTHRRWPSPTGLAPCREIGLWLQVDHLIGREWSPLGLKDGVGWAPGAAAQAVAATET